MRQIWLMTSEEEVWRKWFLGRLFSLWKENKREGCSPFFCLWAWPQVTCSSHLGTWEKHLGGHCQVAGWAEQMAPLSQWIYHLRRSSTLGLLIMGRIEYSSCLGHFLDRFSVTCGQEHSVGRRCVCVWARLFSGEVWYRVPTWREHMEGPPH